MTIFLLRSIKKIYLKFYIFQSLQIVPNPLVEYIIRRTIPLGQRLYTTDICYSGNNEVCISAANSDASCKKDGVKTFYPSAMYITFDGSNSSYLDFIYGTGNSVFSLNTDTRYEVRIWPEACVEEDPIAFGSLPKQGFSPQGLAVRKSGGILICLWNNKVGLKSYGKVIVTGGNSNFH